MAILSALLSTTVPTGMWESIIWAFEGATNNYVWAVVLLTVIIRLIWSPLDTYNRRITAKNAAMNEKIQPELKKLQEKYANDKQTLNQKTNELYKKNNVNMMGSCVFMLVFMVLNLVIFFTLFAGLNNIAGYKIYTNYENLKQHYANSLVLTNEDGNADTFKANYKDGVEFRLFLDDDGQTQQIGLFKTDAAATDKANALYYGKFLTIEEINERDTEPSAEEKEGVEKTDKNGNKVLNAIITDFGGQTLETIPAQEDGGEETKITLLDEVTNAAMPLIQVEYNATKESFWWIENIWIADSPFKSSVFSYSEFAGNARGRIVDSEGEQTIYNAFMPSLSNVEGRVNGYFILPALTLIVSLFSMWLSSFLMNKKGKGGQKQGKVMQFVMPVIMAVFAILYNAVFAIYMLTSQIISTALLPLQQLIVKKLDDRDQKKKLQAAANSNDMDYRRKN